MGKERAIYRERRHEEQRQEASELMQQHWKINDPGKYLTWIVLNRFQSYAHFRLGIP